MTKIKLLISFLFIPVFAFSQNIYQLSLPFYKNYTVNDYRGNSQVWAITKDNDGLVYLGTSSALSIFDGKNWKRYNLDKSITIREFYNYDNNIHFCAENEFGYFFKDKRGLLKIHSFYNFLPDSLKPLGNIWHLIFASHYYYLIAEKNFIVFDTLTKKTYIFPSKRRFKRILNTHKGTFFAFADTLIFFDTSKKNFEVRKNFFPSEGIFIILSEKQENQTFFWVYNTQVENRHQFYIWYGNDSLEKIGELPQRYLTNKLLYSLNKFDNYIFVGTNQGMFIFTINGKFKYRLTTDEGLRNNLIYSVYLDNEKNLWIGTASGVSVFYMGISMGIIDKRMNLPNILPLFAFLDKENKAFYTASGDGILYYKIDSAEKKSLKKLPNSAGQFWDAIKIGENVYFPHNGDIFKLTKDNKFYSTNLIDENVWFLTRYKNTNYYFAGSSFYLYLLKYENDSLKIIKTVKEINGSNRDFTKDKNGDLWILSIGKGIFKVHLDTATGKISYKLINEKQGLETDANNIAYSAQLDEILINYKNKIYRYDTVNDIIIIDKRFVKLFPEGDLSILGQDSLGNLWIQRDTKQSFDVFLVSLAPDKTLTKRELLHKNTLEAIPLTKEIVALTHSDGITLFSIKEILKEQPPKFKALITSVVLSSVDSVLGGYIFRNKIPVTLSYKFKSIAFKFGSSTDIFPENVQFSYKLEGFDKNWSKWTNEILKEYTNLSPGKYVFKLKARDFFGNESEIAEFRFVIKYNNLLIAAYIIVFILIVYGINRLLTYNLKRKNEKLERLVRERTREIELKNKILEEQKKEIELKNAELEQQKEEILTQAEELELINQELQKLSLIVQETDNAVILTDKDGNFVWINPAFTKLFGYTLEELVHEISPNIIADSTAPEIKEKVEKCLREKVTVEYDMKVKNKFNKEIWVHVTLTPLLNDEGEIIGLIAIDSDITELKKAEKRIKEQNENIKASIKYAQTIQESILPKREELEELFETMLIFRPKDIVSGDFYWLSKIYDLNKELVKDFKAGTYFFFAVADATGHGVPGAFMSLIGNRLLNEVIHEHKNHKPSSVLYEIDEKLTEILSRSKSDNKDGMVISLCRFDKIEDIMSPRIHVTFSGAKQSIIYYKKSEDKFYKLRSSARQIGFNLNKDLEFFDQKFMLERDDMIFFYTDGLKDLNNKKRESFGTQKILSILEKFKNKPLRNLEEHLNKEIENWLQNEEPRDDITFIGFRII